jgi:hypothetical protein
MFMILYTMMRLGSLSINLNQVKRRKKGIASATGGNILWDRIKKDISSFFHFLYSKRVKAYPAMTPKITVRIELPKATTRLFRKYLAFSPSTGIAINSASPSTDFPTRWTHAL